jgi:uncharacterized damage-inducible protein DinB
MVNSLNILFAKSLNQLKNELLAYQKEASIWLVEDGFSNSSGVLTKHLLGNLNHFIGAVIGNSGYVRNRELEFENQPVPREFLLGEIDELIELLNLVFTDFEVKKLDEAYPLQVFGEPMTYGYFMMHLLSHLNYHLGQVNYHRRILEEVEA